MTPQASSRYVSNTVPGSINDIQILKLVSGPVLAPVGSVFYGLVSNAALNLGGFEEARLVALPVTVLDAGALVVRFLAFGNADFQLGPTATPVGR